MTRPRATIAYLDCFSGISGDMLLGALLDAGFPEARLTETISGLGLAPLRITTLKTTSQGISATRLNVSTDGLPNHPHRTWQDIRQLLEQSDLPAGVREKARRVFLLLATAEGKIHGCAAEAVHFHEVGAADSIVDIVGVAAGLEFLGIDQVCCSPLPMPSGWVSCEHGRLPLPAPAVCELLTGLPVYGVDLDVELVTPTGAALVKTLAGNYGPLPPMRIERTGYGAGARALPNNQPNLLRLLIGTARSVAEAQQVEVVETHLDDWNPEGYPYLGETLLKKGALDVTLTPILMKKGRPGFLLRVIVPPAYAPTVKECILAETSAIGLRFRLEDRWTLPRRHGTIPTRFGPLRVKLVEIPAGGSRMTPEYEDCRRIAAAHRVPLQEVYAEADRQPQSTFTAEEE